MAGWACDGGVGDRGRLAATSKLEWAWIVCDTWDVAPVPGGPLSEPVSDVPVLLIEGGLDPVAPPRFANVIAAGPTHATVVVILSGGTGRRSRTPARSASRRPSSRTPPRP